MDGRGRKLTGARHQLNVVALTFDFCFRRGSRYSGARRRRAPPPPSPRTKWTRRVPPLVLIGHAASLSQGATGLSRAGGGAGSESEEEDESEEDEDPDMVQPPPPPPSRTNWTRLVPLPVLTGRAVYM